MKPILEQKCKDAFVAGYKKGLQDGWNNKIKAYENEIEFLKKMANIKEENI